MYFRSTLIAAFAFLSMTAAAEARRVALVIGQDSYPGGTSAEIGLPPLHNSRNDARAIAALLAHYGFDVISCDGTSPGCLDRDREALLKALAELERRADGADLALVYFAGHGLASEEGNILTPTDARVDCKTGAVTQGIPVEDFMSATGPARHKLLILDACRDNPIGAVCPALAGKKLSFTRIEPGAMRGLLLVTSTQFGQQALDGLAGTHSPFATALLDTLADNPNIYFEQLFNEVARATHAAAQKQNGFLQIPGKVVGGAAPDDCLAGKDCIGDVRMAALAVENERLGKDAALVRNTIAEEEKQRGKPYTPDERAKRVAELEASFKSIFSSTDPLRREAQRKFDAGDIEGGEAKLDEALDADEAAIAEAERVASEKRKTAARNALDLAVLARGRHVAKALGYYRRAVKFDPDDAKVWFGLGEMVVEAGQLGAAKEAFAQAAAKARDSDDERVRYWATLGLGDVASAQGHLPSARRLYETAGAIADRLASADPGNAGWQRDLAVSHAKVGDAYRKAGDAAKAGEHLRAGRDIIAALVARYPDWARWRQDLAWFDAQVTKLQGKP